MDEEIDDREAMWDEEWRQVEYCLRNGIEDIDGYMEGRHSGKTTDTGRD